MISNYPVFGVIPNNHSIASFLYRRSPLELIRIGTSFPRLPQRLIVKVDTLNTAATSRTVSKSGSESKLSVAITLLSDIEISTLIGACQVLYLSL
jgi:hypothetical protein